MEFKAALCLQGGAMRCVFTAGVLDAFIDNNIEFCDVYGISAATKDMQYYPTKQRGYAYKGDVEAALDNNVFNLANVMLGKPVINDDYYIKEIRDKKFPLDNELLQASKCKLHVGCTNIETCEIEYFEKDDPQFLESMKASCALPVLQPVVDIRGKKYLDGGCSEPVPYKSAMKDGFDKIVVVLTREKGFREDENDSKFNLFYRMKYMNYPKFIELLDKQNKLFNESYDELDQLEKEGKIIVIRPSYKTDVDRLEKNIEKLQKLYQDGYNEGLKALNKFVNYFND